MCAVLLDVDIGDEHNFESFFEESDVFKKLITLAQTINTPKYTHFYIFIYIKYTFFFLFCFEQCVLFDVDIGDEHIFGSSSDGSDV